MMDLDTGAFTSEYIDAYIWHEELPMVRPYNPFDQAEDPLRNEKFLEGGSDEAKPGAEADAVIRGLYRERMKSSYTVDFCEDRFPKGAQFDPLKDDALLASMIRILEPYDAKLLPPVPTSRVVMGYCPMRRYLTERTVYQDDFSKPAYDILRRDLDKGIIRLATKPKKKEVINYAIPPCRVDTKDPEPTWIHLKPRPECKDVKRRRPRILPNPECIEK